MKIYKLFINIILIILLIITINLGYSKFILKEPIQKICGYSILRVISGSMTPSINVNDYILIKECNTYNVGDIITFKVNNILITHRLVEKRGNILVTKGDFNNIADNFNIESNDIEGKVIFITKFLKLKIFLIFLVFIALYIILRRIKK